MLQIKNLSITLKRDLRTIIDNFSFTINDGDKAVVIGEEGNGKSTLLRWIVEPETVEPYADCTGERIFGGERLAYLPQELPEEDREKSIFEFFQDSDYFFTLSQGELNRLCSQFRLKPDFVYDARRMDTLSGGERVKAQLLRILLEQPTVLLLDEPSNDIDAETLQWLEKLIIEWPHIMLFISHDEVLIENTANTVIHIEQLRRKSMSRCGVFHMPYAQFVRERLASFEKQEQMAISDRREKRIRDEKYRKIQQSVEHAQNAVSRQDPHGGRLLKKKMHTVKAIEHRFAREDENMTQMPEYEDAIDVCFDAQSGSVPGGKVILEFCLENLYTPDGERVLARNIGMIVRGPEKVCITGANGAGKTTLLRIIRDSLTLRTDIKCIYMPQNYEEMLDMEKSPIEFLNESGEKDERTKIRSYLGALRYTTEEMEHPIGALSGGQKAKILLLKLIFSGANVLILDEPTRNFSPLSGPVIRKMLREFPGAIISVSHDRKYMAEVCDTIYRLTPEGLIKI